MKRFVLLTVLLQLCLSVLEVNAGGGGRAAGAPVGEVVNENQLQFGDLLVTPHFFISHYAVYVGREPFEGKNDNQNIFEMMKNPDGCRFHTAEHPFRRHNYLDPGIAPEGQSIVPQDRNRMIQTIRDLMNRPVCQTYNVFTSNCEQIATKVRYGESHCMQKGNGAEPGAKLFQAGTIHRREAPAAA